MKSNNDLKQNFIYNLAYQILILIIPLITAPYLSRVVGPSGVGVYSYTYSIVYYFMILVLLGVNNYGNRMIAKNRDDKEELSKTFWSIYLFQLLMGIIMLILYIVYILILNNEYKSISLIEAFFILSAILDINWFFFGIEDFKKNVIRSTFVKISNVILIFLFVKSSNDLWKYVLIMSGMTCLSQIILWRFLKDKINFTKVTWNDVRRHIKPNFILFIPVVAVSIYKMMDKIMLGILANVTEVGFYEQAEKIINIPIAIISSLGTIMLPRISNLAAKGEEKKINEYIEKSVSFMMFMAFPMSFGLMAISYNFAPLYFGEEFQKTGILMILLATTIPFLSFANVLRTEYLIPKEMDKVYIISVTLGAITNLVMNLVLIPRFSSIGACIGTILAEFIVMLYQAIILRKKLKILTYVKSSFHYFLHSIVMLCLILMLNYVKISDWYRLILQIIFGGLIYGVLNTKYILNIINLKKCKIKLAKEK